MQSFFVADGLVVIPVGEDRASSISQYIDTSGDLAEYELHRLRQPSPWCTDHQMEMVAHHHVGKELQLVLLHSECQCARDNQRDFFGVGREDKALVETASGNEVRAVREVMAEWAHPFHFATCMPARQPRLSPQCQSKGGVHPGKSLSWDTPL